MCIWTNYCTPAIDTSEVIVGFLWHFPADFRRHFPTDLHFSVVVSKGWSLSQWIFYIPQRGVQWKQGVVVYMTLYTSLLYGTTPIHCTPHPLHPPPCRVSNCHFPSGFVLGIPNGFPVALSNGVSLL